MTKVDSGRDIVVTVDDARISGFCGRGMSNWGEPHGLSVRSLIAGEVTVGQLEDMNDAFANRAAQAARKRVADGRR